MEADIDSGPGYGGKHDPKIHGPLNFKKQEPETITGILQEAWKNAFNNTPKMSAGMSEADYASLATDHFYFNNKAPGAARRKWKREQMKNRFVDASVAVVSGLARNIGALSRKLPEFSYKR